MLIHGFHQHRFVRKAHVHSFDKFHELVCHVLCGNQIPAVLFGDGIYIVFLEIVEETLISDGNGQIRFDFSLFDISLYGFCLHVHHTNKFQLRSHSLDGFLPVKQIDHFVIISVDGNIQPSVGAFPFECHIFSQFLGILRADDIATGVILANIQQTVQAVRLVEHIGIVYEIKNKQICFALTSSCPAPQLLHINRFGHGGSCHEKNFRVRAVPAFIEQVAGTEHIRFSCFVVFQYVISDFHFIATGNRFRFDALFFEKAGNFCSMIHTSAKDNRLLPFYIFDICVYNQLISFGNEKTAL